MSLFKCRDWWSTHCGSGEEFDKGCLSVANLDNDPSGNVKIITGSFQGFLRIYYPKKRDYRVDDLMLELNLGAPIIQLEVGRFIPNSFDLALAVLHPRKLTVYQLTSRTVAANQNSYYSLDRKYEHSFERYAANMTLGPFGGVVGRDFICVQSMDGMLSVYEQDCFAFSRFLHPFLLPGPLCYVALIDSMVTANSAYQVECYKYQTLAASETHASRDPYAHGAGNGSDHRGPNAVAAAKRMQADWSTNIGEAAIDVFIARFTRNLSTMQADIVVVGEHTLFCLKETGALRMQKKLDLAPSCAHAFPAVVPSLNVSGEDETVPHNLMLGTHLASLVVFRDIHLAWASKLESIPVALRTARFGGLMGLIVSLDDRGALGVHYLGTDPSNNVVNSPIDNKDLNYEDMDKELRALQSMIRDASTVARSEPPEKLIMRIQPQDEHAPGLDLDVEEDPDPDAETDLRSPSVVVRVLISHNGPDVLKNVNIAVSVPDAIKVNIASLVLETVGKTPAVLPLSFRASSTLLPSSLAAVVVAAYTTAKGEPRTGRLEIALPLRLACRIGAPTKTGTHKIDVEINRKTLHLGSLFEDVGAPSSEDTPQDSASILSFRYHCGPDVLILVSKSGGKYRVQSASFEAIWLIVSELVRRIEAYYAAETAEDPLQISYNEELPFQEYFEIIDQHFRQRQALAGVRAELGRRAEQFRAVQKRLLVRFKDRNAVPLAHMDALLAGTFEQLGALATQVQSKEKDLKNAANRLSCATQLMQRLMRYHLHLDDHNVMFLQTYFSSVVTDTVEQGWEEATDAALVQLLRTSLAISPQDASTLPQLLEAPEDTSALQQHIRTVCERLANGMRFPKPAERKKKAAGAKDAASPAGRTKKKAAKR